MQYCNSDTEPNPNADTSNADTDAYCNARGL
jgi:hypothetical protein